MGKKSSRLGPIGRVREVPDRDDGRGRRVAGRGRGNEEIRRSKFLDARPHPAIKIFDGEGFGAPPTELFKPPKGALELGLGNSSSPSAVTIVWGGNRELFEFGEEASSTNFGPRRLLIRRETGDEILRGI
jgi:hypothetical protein